MTEKKDRAIALRAATLPTEREMHPMVEKMLELNPTPESLEKIMKVQQDWEAGKAKRAYTEALVELKKALPAFIVKNKGADMGTSHDGKARPKYTYATLAALYRQVNDILGDHGFALTAPATTYKDEKGGTVIRVTATLTHHAGHSETTVMEGPPDITGAKSVLQQLGASVTYLQRYTSLSLLGLATDDMDDVDAQAKPASETPPKENIDPQRNLKAMGFFVQSGRKKEEIEKFVGKPVAKWTDKDLEKLRGWMQAPAAKPAAAKPAPKPEAPAPREPGADESEDGSTIFDFHCPQPGCGYHNADESLYVDHLNESGHKEKPKEGVRK